jgi:hypothetical protein
VTVLETDARFRQYIQSWSRILFAPIAAETFETHIIRHDKQDVYRFVSGRGYRLQHREKSQTGFQKLHRVKKIKAASPILLIV